MIERDHLDRVERFAHWLEDRRKQAGFTQRELAERSGISHSYYSKVVHIGHIRQQYGDEGREVTAPRSMNVFKGALTALAERLGDGCREEGMGVWGSLDTTERSNVNKVISHATDKDKAGLLSDALEKLLKLSEERLRLVNDLLDNLR